MKKYEGPKKKKHVSLPTFAVMPMDQINFLSGLFVQLNVHDVVSKQGYSLMI